jgi:hypothetical protein
MKKYDLSELKRFKAPYLEHGFKEEAFELREFHYDPEASESIGKFEVIKHYTTPNEPDFYLDSLAAIRLIYQLGVITICLEKNVKEERTFPIFTRGTTLHCKKFIRHKNVDIKLKLARKKELKDGTYYCCAVDVCNGAFTGEIKIMLHPYSFYQWE